MVTVKVVWRQSGRPAKGERVGLGFDGLTGGNTRGEYTDANGDAHFNVGPGMGKVYVNGHTKYHGHLSGRVVVYI